MQDVIAPLNHEGDKQPSYWKRRQGHHDPQASGGVQGLCRRRLAGLQHPTEFGGQGRAKVIAAACSEMLQAASMSFALCPLLTGRRGGGLLTAGSPSSRQLYIPSCWMAPGPAP